jgi:hypothetical protein
MLELLYMAVADLGSLSNFSFQRPNILDSPSSLNSCCSLEAIVLPPPAGPIQIKKLAPIREHNATKSFEKAGCSPTAAFGDP